jgi:DNA (cytosine-5)-methyltransferase 1
MKPWTVIDLFSGTGGMSFGFHARKQFRICGAVDVQSGKPSSGHGSLECNSSYQANIGVEPIATDLMTADPADLASKFGITKNNPLTVLSSCAPCTGFSRTVSKNHLKDDARNSLVSRSALFVREFQPQVFLMENARELIKGNFSHHYANLAKELEKLGYRVHGKTHFLNRFGLPQIRERALVIAVHRNLELRTIDDLWEGYEVKQSATHVRQAIAGMPILKAGETDTRDPLHASPLLGPINLKRLDCIPKDGGSWADLRYHADKEALLTPAMLRYIKQGKFGSHPDVYGRMAWDKPAPTIKRECGHIGNGRYAHPEQNRLCSIRELAILQGFPKTYRFVSKSASNKYRHIGDAVPPIISYQLSAVCKWILTGKKPSIEDLILKDTHLNLEDIQAKPNRQKELFG